MADLDYKLDIQQNAQVMTDTRDKIRTWLGDDDYVVAFRRINWSGPVVYISNVLAAFWGWSGATDKASALAVGRVAIPAPDALVNIADAQATCGLILDWVGGGGTLVAARVFPYWYVGFTSLAHAQSVFGGFPPAAQLEVKVAGQNLMPQERIMIPTTDYLGQVLGLEANTPAAAAFIDTLAVDPANIENFLAQPQQYLDQFQQQAGVQFTGAEVQTLLNASHAHADQLRLEITHARRFVARF